jgi:hypothetical protein
MNEKTQLENAAEMGLCPCHTWQLAAMASPQGISRGYAPLMDHLSNKLMDLANSQQNPEHQIGVFVNNYKKCRVCIIMKNQEVLYLKHFKAFLDETEGRRLYSSSHGLCLCHLFHIIEIISLKNIVQFLLLEAAKHFKETAEDMRQYALKHETLQKSLCSRDEKDAYLRGLRHIAGSRGIAGSLLIDI